MDQNMEVAQSCPTLGYTVHNSPGQESGVGSHSLLQGIFPTQGLNPGLVHCRQIFYQLSHQGSPRILEWVAHLLFQGIFPTQGSNLGLLHCRRILYHLSHQGSPRILEWVAYPFSRGIFPTQESILYQLSYPGSLLSFILFSFIFPFGWAGSSLPCTGSLFLSMGSVAECGALAASQHVGS